MIFRPLDTLFLGIKNILSFPFFVRVPTPCADIPISFEKVVFHLKYLECRENGEFLSLLLLDDIDEYSGDHNPVLVVVPKKWNVFSNVRDEYIDFWGYAIV